MSKKNWSSGLDTDVKSKVKENLAGHNLRIVGFSKGVIHAICTAQANRPRYKVLAGKKERVQKRIKNCAGIIIPTCDKEVAIIAEAR